MEAQQNAQDVTRCDLCETAQPQSFCDFCHVNLCRSCVGEHIADEYDKHKIVPYQQRKSTLIYPKCKVHQNKRCDHLCKYCNISICSFCFASKQHNGHTIFEIIDIYNAKKENIQKDREEVASLISPTYEEISKEFEKKIACLDRDYESIKIEISEKGEEWHREIDTIINEMKLEVDEIKNKHRDILQRHLVEVKQTQSIIHQVQIALLKHLEKSNDVLPIIQYTSKNTEFRKLPSKPQIAMPKFISTPIDDEKLRCQIGEISPLSTAMEERDFTTKTTTKSVEELLNDTEILDTIETNHENLRCITFLNEDQIWTSGLTGEIKCLNIGGVLCSTLDTRSGDRPNDIVVDRDRTLLYSDEPTKSINKVKNDQTEEVIQLHGWIPFNLCHLFW
uniref:Uncharacterized protein LOC111107160 n=1 Tax=Crassostrea virginica TaxID=6565 RepID=A0A8B8B3B5_CRAVI|nr:uncharacterized protein LOC111107160 [Crassostrea virginica]